MALTVTIGRNKGTVPMAQRDWEAFQSDILLIVRSNTPAIYFVGTGTGIYEGAEEESFTVIAGDATQGALAAIRVSLAYIAEVFGQECVAITQGETQFVYATRH